MAKNNKVLEEIVKLLDKKKVPYEVVTHKEVYMAKDIASAAKCKEKEIAKVLLLKTEKGKMFAGILPADLMVKIKKIKAKIGAKELTMVTEREMKSATKCEPGAVPALTNLFGIKAFVDPELLKNSKIVFRGGSYTESVKIPSESFLSASKAEELPFSVKPSAKRKSKPKPKKRK